MSDSTGIPAVDSLAVWCAAGGIIVGGLLALWRVVRRLGEFLDDWAGEPGRPGVPARPGVMVRLDGIDRRLTDVEHGLRVDRRERHAVPVDDA